MFTRNIIIIIILIIILFILYNNITYTSTPQFKGRGYCNINSEYIQPKMFSNFISKEDADYIIQKSQPLFKESRLVSGSLANIRKSETAWLSKNDPVVEKIIKRVCKISNIPFENSEKMQVVKYEPNGYYKPHYDASCDDKEECVNFEKNGGQRVITMIIYLNDDFTGGMTDFPNLKMEFIPKKYSSLFFYSLEKNGNKCHPLSLHAGTPVKTGIKYIANVWLRERKYDDNIKKVT